MDWSKSQSFEAAIRILGLREHSTHELRTKLARRNLDLSQFDQLANELERLGYLSDERFASEYVRSRMNRGDGPVKIEAELQKRGVSCDVIEEYVTNDEAVWLDQARTLVAKRFPAVQTPPQPEELDQISRLLQAKGYRSNTIMAVRTARSL